MNRVGEGARRSWERADDEVRGWWMGKVLRFLISFLRENKKFIWGEKSRWMRFRQIV